MSRRADDRRLQPASEILRRPTNNGGEVTDHRRGDRAGIRFALPPDHHRGRSRSNSPGHHARPQDQGRRPVPRLPRLPSPARLGHDNGPDPNRLPRGDDNPVYFGRAVPRNGGPLEVKDQQANYARQNNLRVGHRPVSVHRAHRHYDEDDEHDQHSFDDWLPRAVVAQRPGRVLAPAAQPRPLGEVIDLRSDDDEPAPRPLVAGARQRAPHAQANNDLLHLRMLQIQRREEEDYLRAQEDVNREEEAVRRALEPVPFTQEERDRRQAVDLCARSDNHRRAQEDMRRANEDLANQKEVAKEMEVESRRKTKIFLRAEKEMAREVKAARRAGQL